MDDKKRLVESRYAWGINVRYMDLDGKYYPGFIGRMWINHIWDDTDDIRQAIFRTRKSARLVLPRIKNSFPDAKIVKIKIIIQEED